MQPPTQVFIVDDLPSMRERLRELLGELPDVSVIGDAGTPTDAIAGILATRPACVLPTTSSSAAPESTCCARSPATARHRLVVLTNHPDPQYRQACMAAGATHFLDKSTEFDRIPDVLRQMRS